MGERFFWSNIQDPTKWEAPQGFTWNIQSDAEYMGTRYPVLVTGPLWEHPLQEQDAQFNWAAADAFFEQAYSATGGEHEGIECGTTSMDPRPADWREPRADDYLGEVVMSDTKVELSCEQLAHMREVFIGAIEAEIIRWARGQAFEGLAELEAESVACFACGRALDGLGIKQI